MPKPNKQIIIDAIIKEIEKGNSYKNTFRLICTKSDLAISTFATYWKTANEQHTEAQTALKSELAEISKQAAIERLKKAIMTADERKEYLTKLILGEIEVPYTEVKWDKEQDKFVMIKLVELAGHTARVSAIAELNKMEGDYSPSKIAITDKDGNDKEQTLIIWGGKQIKV